MYLTHLIWKRESSRNGIGFDLTSEVARRGSRRKGDEIGQGEVKDFIPLAPSLSVFAPERVFVAQPNRCYVTVASVELPHRRANETPIRSFIQVHW